MHGAFRFPAALSPDGDGNIGFFLKIHPEAHQLFGKALQVIQGNSGIPKYPAA